MASIRVFSKPHNLEKTRVKSASRLNNSMKKRFEFPKTRLLDISKRFSLSFVFEAAFTRENSRKLWLGKGPWSPQRPPRGPPGAQEPSRGVPRGLQGRKRGLQEPPRLLPRVPKSAPRALKSAPRAPKSFQVGPEAALRALQRSNYARKRSTASILRFVVSWVLRPCVVSLLPSFVA